MSTCDEPNAEDTRRQKRAQAVKYSDYVLIMTLRSERFTGFLWDVSDAGLGAIFPLRGRKMDFVNPEDHISGSVVNHKIGVKLDFVGQVRWRKPFELERVAFLHLGVQFQGTVILPLALSALSLAKSTT